jgi:hypothetical protein
MYIVSLLIFSSAFSGIISTTLTQLVMEKETKQRETLRIMSLSRLAYTSSHFLSQAIYCALTALCLCLGFYLPLSRVHNSENILSTLQEGYLQVFCCMVLFGCSLVALCMACSTLYQDSKIAGQLGTLIVYLPIAIFVIIAVDRFLSFSETYLSISEEKQTGGLDWIYLTMVLPQFPLGVILMDLFSGGFAYEILNIKLAVAWVALCIQIPVFILLYSYLDRVIPNEFGISKPCFYCCRKRREQIQVQQQYCPD